jgi:hypothetical protein
VPEKKAVRYPIPRVRERPGRTVDERVTLRFPRLARVTRAAIMGLPLGSRLRRAILRRAIAINAAAYNRRDLDAFLSPFDPGMEVRLVGHVDGVDVESRYEGYEGVMEFTGALDEVWEAPRFEPRELIDFGDRYLLLINSRGRGRASGVLGEHSIALLMTWRRGVAARADFYWGQDQALEAVGMRYAAARTGVLARDTP